MDKHFFGSLSCLRYFKVIRWFRIRGHRRHVQACKIIWLTTYLRHRTKSPEVRPWGNQKAFIGCLVCYGWPQNKSFMRPDNDGQGLCLFRLPFLVAPKKTRRACGADRMLLMKVALCFHTLSWGVWMGAPRLHLAFKPAVITADLQTHFQTWALQCVHNVY